MVKEWKKNEVKELKGLIDKHSVIGIVNMHKMPAPQLQQMRKDLKGIAKIRMSKKILMKFALEKSDKENIEKLKNHMRGQPAFIFSDMNPFKLFKYLDKNKTKAPARPGDIAPKDIIVNSGNTGLSPGPVIGQLQDVGIPISVKEGSIAVEKDTVVVEEDNEINNDLANVLNTLGIEPIEIGLDLVTAYESGIIFPKDILRVDEEKYIEELKNCISKAINLSINSNYPTRLNIKTLIQKSFMEMKNLALEGNIYDSSVLKEMIYKAETEKRLIENRYLKK